MLGTKKILVLCCSVALAGCVTAEGDETVNWNNLPGDMPPGIIRADLIRQSHDEFLVASGRLPLVDTLSCGPFQVALNANPATTTAVSNIVEVGNQGGRGELFSGYFLTVLFPDGFTDRIRFRQLIFPDLNARIFLQQNGEWRDVTNPERTIEPPMEPDLYRDIYPSHKSGLNGDTIFEGKFIVHQPWAPFLNRSVFWNNGSPEPRKGRYRISFITPYEIEWPDGSCEFTLPDMELEYR